MHFPSCQRKLFLLSDAGIGNQPNWLHQSGISISFAYLRHASTTKQLRWRRMNECHIYCAFVRRVAVGNNKPNEKWKQIDKITSENLCKKFPHKNSWSREERRRDMRAAEICRNCISMEAAGSGERKASDAANVKCYTMHVSLLECSSRERRYGRETSAKARI